MMFPDPSTATAKAQSGAGEPNWLVQSSAPAGLSFRTKASSKPMLVWPDRAPSVRPATMMFPDPSTATANAPSEPREPNWRVHSSAPAGLSFRTNASQEPVLVWPGMAASVAPATMMFPEPSVATPLALSTPGEPNWLVQAAKGKGVAVEIGPGVAVGVGMGVGVKVRVG